MLKILEVENYQSHKNTVIEFHKGMNVITGTSDSGKSALIRAMLWALKNRPSGESFKRWDAGEKEPVIVSMEFDNDWFTKCRSNGKNKYGSEDGNYEALRSDVPEPIQAIHNIVEYNIQTQFQPYFMLQDSAGDRAKKLNDLVGLGIIDSIFKKLNGKIQITKQEVTRTETEINRLIEVVESYSELPSIESRIDKLTTDIDTMNKTAEKSNSLQEMITKLCDITVLIDQQSNILKAEKQYHLLINKIESSEIDEIRYKDLNLMCVNLHNAEKQMAEDMEWLSVEVPYLKIKTAIKQRGETKEKEMEFKKYVDAYFDLEDRIITEQNNLDSKQDEYESKLKESGTCPLCKTKIGKGFKYE